MERREKKAKPEALKLLEEQKKERETNPPPPCTCEPQKLFADQVLEASTPGAMGHECRVDERTGMRVCVRCGGIPPQGTIIWTPVTMEGRAF